MKHNKLTKENKQEFLESEVRELREENKELHKCVDGLIKYVPTKNLVKLFREKGVNHE